MRIRILGAGWYGCHLAWRFEKLGHAVELHESARAIFSGASGAIPARLHLGFHYPRSRVTRAACQEHRAEFMQLYGPLTQGVPVNVYAIADHDSMVDFGSYLQVLRGELEFVQLERPAELGLDNVEGAILTGERHIVIARARAFFEKALGPTVHLMSRPADSSAERFDWTVDCTFCARDSEGVERYEPCVTGLLEGPIGQAVTVMDGPFPSLYPWDEQQGLCSLTSARFTPFGRFVNRSGAEKILAELKAVDIRAQVEMMREQLAHFWPASRDLFHYVDARLSIRAMPRSGSDARLVDVVRTGPRELRIRAGKIDAVMQAERRVLEIMCSQ